MERMGLVTLNKQYADNSALSSGRFVFDQIYLLVTRQCNITCSHCIRSSSPYNREFMDTEFAIRTIDSISAINKNTSMIISGGEPTLHKDFGLIARHALKSFNRVVINTNGLRYKSLVDLVDDPSLLVQISIDGDESTHNNIRGEGTFSKTLNNIIKLNDIGANITIATTVSNGNIKSIEALDLVLSKINFNRWNVKRIVGSGRASDLDDIATSTWNDFVLTQEKRSLNKNRMKISSMFSEGSFSIKASEDSDRSEQDKSLNCGTGRSKFYINPNGTVYPCACMENNIVGDLSRQPLETIVNAVSAFDVEPSENSICHLCPSWSNCRGGCPGAAMRTNESNQGDPRCHIVELACMEH